MSTLQRAGPVRDVMRFHLIYSGPLRASGNKSKLRDQPAIRLQFHWQLRQLWKTHNALKVLKAEGARRDPEHPPLIGSPRKIARYAGSPYVDCLTNIPVKEQDFFPLIRESLNLSCELDILFLRKQDPGKLVTQGGDIDGRVKLLLDALRMPSPDEQERAPTTAHKAVHCLLENDSLVSRLNVDTDRLLFPETEKEDEVHLVIEVTTNVLQVGPHNVCLL